MENKKRKVFIKVSLVLLLICLFQFATRGEETKDHQLESWEGEEWLGGDFSDVECGEVIIHISFSEEARKVLGTCEEPVNVLIRSEGTWWTYGGRDWYSDIVQVTFDKINGYQLRKKLPYGRYAINDMYYLGNVNSSDYAYPCPIVFELSEEEPEIPVFFEFKKQEKIEGSTVINGNYYIKLYNEYKKKGLNPYGKILIHAAPEDLEGEYFVVVEVAEGRSQKITEIHYFGKTNDYTYMAELYPGIYQIHRVYYIDREGNVLGEDEEIKNFEFEALPQSDVIEVNLKIRENQEKVPVIAETEASKEIIEINLNKKIDLENRIRLIIYHLTALMVMAGLISAVRYFWREL